MYQPEQAEVDAARALLESRGFTVLRTKSYRAAQERLRVAQALQEAAEDRLASYEDWVREKLIPEERRLHARLTEVYGHARAAGASVEDLTGQVPGTYAKGGLVEGDGSVTVVLRPMRPCRNGHQIAALDGVVQHIISQEDARDPGRIREILWCEKTLGSQDLRPA